jgi:glutamate dehydrogenase (NAD(P)+)
VVAVSDVKGGIYRASGLDIPSLVALVGAGGSVIDAPGVELITNEELLACECDVLIPAALGEVIHGDNADSIRAQAIVEAANYPITPDGDKILGDRGITVLPDILANAGGVTGSYFEWSQNIQQFTWKESRFNEELLDKMQGAYRDTAAFAEEHNCSLRRAAYAIGIERVAAASRKRGYV